MSGLGGKVAGVLEDTFGWLREHGEDRVEVRLIDLLSVVARLEQVGGDPAAHPVTFDRLFTCDLPRLRQYLPDGALEELDR